MPLQHAVWKVGSPPIALEKSYLDDEDMLEKMIVDNPKIISEEWMLIGKQVKTGSGGFIDLLAIALDGSLIVIELKKDKTPREVTAQALDYASWVAKLGGEQIAQAYSMFRPGQSLDEAFRKFFGSTLDEDYLNQDHKIVIVASSLDESTDRIITYLAERGVNINVLFFQVFTHGLDKLLSRAWLIESREQVTEGPTTSREKGVWNGEYYVSFGEGTPRSWGDAQRLGFISAGGGVWYTRTLKQLSPGNRVWVNVPGHGYVGVGRVTGKAEPASKFKVHTSDGEKPVLDAAKGGHYFKDEADNEERCEWFVPIKWLDTVSVDDAVHEIGMFGNQNTVAQPTTPKWDSTVKVLMRNFPDYDKPVMV